MNILSWILTAAISLGQLVKIPLGTHGGVTLLDITVLGSCLLGLARLRFHLKKPPPIILTALFFIFVALFSLIMTPLKLTQQEFLTSFFYIIRFTSFILLGWLIYLGVFPVLRKNIPQIFLISGLALAILGLLQFIFIPDLRFLASDGWDPHYFRAVSTFLDPNFLGAYLVLTLSLLIHLRGVFLRPDETSGGKFCLLTPRVFYIVFTIIYLALLATFSRGTYLAFLTSFGTLSILTRSIRLGFLTILLFLGLLLGFSTYQRLVAIPRNIDRTQSAKFRLGSWQQGWQLFQQHPILGVGFNTYRYALKQYNLADEQFLKSHGASTNDSSLLYVATTTGIVGSVSYLLFLGSLLIPFRWPNGLLKSGHDQIILIVGLLGLLSQSFFANTLFYPFLLVWLILMAAKSNVHKA